VGAVVRSRSPQRRRLRAAWWRSPVVQAGSGRVRRAAVSSRPQPADCLDASAYRWDFPGQRGDRGSQRVQLGCVHRGIIRAGVSAGPEEVLHIPRTYPNHRVMVFAGAGPTRDPRRACCGGVRGWAASGGGGADQGIAPMAPPRLRPGSRCGGSCPGRRLGSAIRSARGWSAARAPADAETPGFGVPVPGEQGDEAGRGVHLDPGWRRCTPAGSQAGRGK